MTGIVRYKINIEKQFAIGLSVVVRIGNKSMKVFYQFGDATVPYAVVHPRSGQRICEILNRETGYPQQRAQQAIDRVLKRYTPEVIHQRIQEAPSLNSPIYDVVGVLK